MESVFYEFETQKNMDKVDIIRKHIGNDDFYDINGTPLLTKILSAMDEYAQQQVKNCSIPAVSGSADRYTKKLDKDWDDDIYTIEEWNKTVDDGWIISDDGCGYWVKDGFKSRDEVFSTSPLDATHVVWYNK